MAVNEYMTPLLGQHQNTFVDTYIPLNFDYLQGQLQDKQNQYNSGELYTTNLLNNVTAQASNDYHKQELESIKQNYTNDINSILESSNGDYSLVPHKLQQVGSSLKSDLEQGNLYRINSTTQNYVNAQKKIDEIGKRTGVNMEDAMRHLNGTYGAYANSQHVGTHPFQAFDYGERIKFNDILDKAVGNLKADGYTKLIGLDKSDPEYYTKVKTEYLSDPKVRGALTKTIASQPGIREEAMYHFGVGDPSQVTDKQLADFINFKVAGPTQGAVFSKTDKDLNFTPYGTERGKKKVQDEVDQFGVSMAFNSPISTGSTPEEFKTNYTNREQDLRHGIVAGLYGIGLKSADSKLTLGDGNTYTLEQIANNPKARENFISAIKSGNIPGYSPDMLRSLKTSVLPIIEKNELLQQRHEEALTVDVDKAWQKLGGEVYIAGHKFDKQQFADLKNYALTGNKGSAYVGTMGEFTGDPQDHRDVLVINGKPVNADKQLPMGSENIRRYKVAVGTNSSSEYDKYIEEKGNVKGNTLLVNHFGEVAGVNTAPIMAKTTKALSEAGVQNMITYNDPQDPSGGKQVSKFDAVRTAFAQKMANDPTLADVDINKISPEPASTLYSITPVNGKSVAAQTFYIGDEKIPVTITTNLDQLVSKGVMTQQELSTTQIGQAVQELTNSGTATRTLYDTKGNAFATWDNDKKLVVTNENGKNYYQTQDEFIRNNPNYFIYLANRYQY